MYKKCKKFEKNGLVIGLTGNIGVGKSLVLKYFHKKGFFTYSADEIVKQEYNDKNSQFYQLVLNLFRNEKKIDILNPDFSIDKNKMLEIMLKDVVLIKKLNDITKKTVLKRLEKFIIYGKKNYKFSIIEIPILFEMDLQKKEYIDLILTIKTQKDFVKKRIFKQRKLTDELYSFFLKNQFDYEKKILDKKEIIIYNNTTIFMLQKKLNYFINIVKKIC
ncbi:MAG: dephospho-CoA kinase [Elusimicrobiota bacterium]|jgi:dephospho-CoA kinase|nr:dephospho-CoA kinase [Elusimicrobiota bacterium]